MGTYRIKRLIDTTRISLSVDISLDMVSLGAKLDIADGEACIDIDLIVFGIYLSITYKK